MSRRISQGERYCAVFDGHFGEGCAEYCCSRFHEELQRSPYWFAFNDKDAITQAFAEIHAQYMEAASDQSGTTATVALIRGRTIHVASVGNSRAVLYSAGTASALTKDDYKPEVPPPGLMRTNPAVIERTLQPTDEFVLLASDGVWE